MKGLRQEFVASARTHEDPRLLLRVVTARRSCDTRVFLLRGVEDVNYLRPMVSE